MADPGSVPAVPGAVSVRRPLAAPLLVVFLVVLSLAVGFQSAETNVIRAADDAAPALRKWQARRVVYGYAIREQRPLFRVTGVSCSGFRCRVVGEEPGYLFLEDGPDVTVTLVERRRFQFWVRDPFSRVWVRWL